MKARHFALLIAGIILAVILLASCTTTKYVDREIVKTDNSVIVQNEGLQAALQETIERYEKEKETWLKTGILFDTVYRNDTVVVNKVTFDNGRVKQVEGRILAVNHSLLERSAELYDAHNTIDDLTTKLERVETELSKKQTVITKEVKRTVWPYWLFVICFIAGLIVEYKAKIVKRILSLKIRL